MKRSFSNLSLRSLLRLALIGQPSLFLNLDAARIVGYKVGSADIYLSVTKYYKSGNIRAWSISPNGKVPDNLSNLKTVQKLIRYRHVSFEEGERRVEVYETEPSEHDLIEACVLFTELKESFK